MSRFACFKMTVFGVALMLGLAIAPQSKAALLFSGTIFDTPTTIDYHRFEVLTPGTIDIDVLSRDVLGGDFRGVSGLDPYIHLFAFDAFGDLGLLGAHLAEADDGGLGSDGSTNSRDSFLSLFLGSGDYVVAISDYFLSEAEARAGVDDGASFFRGTFADYEIRISGDARPPTVVFEPATLGLLGFGLLAVWAARRRKQTI